MHSACRFRGGGAEVCGRLLASARRQRVLGERTACSAWHAVSMPCLSRGEYCAALCQLLAVLIGGALLCTGIAMRAHDAFYRARVAVGVLCSVTMLFAACEIYSAAAHAVLIRVDARGLFYRALALGSGLSSFRAWAFRLRRGLWAHAKPSFSEWCTVSCLAAARQALARAMDRRLACFGGREAAAV